jgi:hypothetical protein
VQIKELEAPSILPTVEALDAEFGCEDENCATGRSKRGSDPMNARFTPSQFEFPAHLGAARPTGDGMNQSSLDAASVRRSLGRRALRRLARFLIVFCVGVGTTLAWQSYGDAARAMIANSSPQLAWLEPQAAPVGPTATDVVAPAAAASSDVQQLAFGLAAVRQSIDLLAAQLAAGQQQMGGDIAKLQADDQEILHKLSATPLRPTAAPAHKPAPVTPPPSSAAPAH